MKASEPRNVHVTAYGGGALVTEEREIQLEAGTTQIDVEGIPTTINRRSIVMRPIDGTEDRAFSLLEQNYQYDVISPDNVLRKAVGEKVTIQRITENGDLIAETGTILNCAQSTSDIVLRRDSSGEILLYPQGSLLLEKIPETLSPLPKIQWLISTEKSGPRTVQITYLAKDMEWSADYVALVSAEEDRLDLTGWVTLKNESGGTFPDARLTLLAGDVHLVREPDNRHTLSYELYDSVSAGSFKEETFSEYHIYKLDRRTTIRDRETKQIALLEASGVRARKRLVFEPRMVHMAWRPGSGTSTIGPKSPQVVLEVENKEEHGLGIPLPKGIVRVYKADGDGDRHMVGEDSISHSPRGETLKLLMGDAFDVRCTFKCALETQQTRNVGEGAFEVLLRNAKESDVEVEVIDHFFGEWKILQSSHDHEVVDASTARFKVPVPARSEVKLDYHVRVHAR